VTVRARTAMVIAWTAVFLGCGSILGCDSLPKRVDRTGGLAVEVLWTSADSSRASYFAVGTDGVFRSSGGVSARARATQYSATLSDEDVARAVTLVRATDFASRPRTAGEAGDRSEVLVAEHGRSARFATVGVDASVDALVGFCRELSLRQFRDVIEAQPVAGERRR